MEGIAAALNVTEPSSTGIGGDMFCLFYDARTKKVHSLNGSGRYAQNGTLKQVRKDLNIPSDRVGSIPFTSALAVTVPGAAAGWVDTVERFGRRKLSLGQILKPAIELAEEGFPVSELSSYAVSLLCFVLDSHRQYMKFYLDGLGIKMKFYYSHFYIVESKRAKYSRCLPQFQRDVEERSESQRWRAISRPWRNNEDPYLGSYLPYASC